MPEGKTVKTETVKTSEPGAAQKAARAVLSGGVVVYPTETLYGIGGLASRRDVAARVSRIKKRPDGKPFPVLARDIGMLSRYFVISEKQKDAYRKMFPLPLTLVLRCKNTDFFPPQISKDGKTAVRVSHGEFVRGLFELLDEPLISSSANISGGQNLSCGEEAGRIFGGTVELIVDSGNLPPSKGSAIADLTGETPEILRKGDLDTEQTSEFLKWLS